MKFDRTKAKRIMPGLFQLAPDRFVVITQWKDPRTGRRRKRERVVQSLAEAVTLRQELKGEEQGRARKATPVCLSDFVEQWLRVHAHRFAPSTRDRYAEALAHACVAMGDIYVSALEAADIRKWVSDQGPAYAAATINGRLRVLKQALDDAVVDRVLASNPARAVRSLKEPRTRGPRGTALSAEQFRALLEATRQLSGAGISEDVARMLQVVAWTGLRRGELLALRFTDQVDGELRIERSVWRHHERPTKTDDPRRITVVPPLARVLQEQRSWLLRRQHPGLGSALVFPASPSHARTGKQRRGVGEVSYFRSGSMLDRPLAKVVRAAGLPRISLHSLRRTWEDLLREAGVDDLVRRAMAGWRSPGAQAIYASVDRRERDAAVGALLEYVTGGAQ